MDQKNLKKFTDANVKNVYPFFLHLKLETMLLFSWESSSLVFPMLYSFYKIRVGFKPCTL